MANESVDFSEILVTPLAAMIRQMGEGVAAAQSALDAAALLRQKEIEHKEEHKALAEIGYQVTWYQMPEVVAELKVAVHYEETGAGSARRTGVFLSPFNAKYKNAFTYAAEGASTLKLRIVPVPPPPAASSA